MEMGNVKHTVGSQFLITLSEGNGLKDMVVMDDKANDTGENENKGRYLSLGRVVEDPQEVLSKLNRAYCDDDGRPFADIRIQRALVIHDPFEDPPEMEELLKARGVELDGMDQSAQDLMEGYPLAPQSPEYERPPEEIVPLRIKADDTTLFANEYRDDSDEDEETKQKRLEMQQKQEEEWKQRQDTSRAVMLEMLGDLPSAEIRAPENVLFVCKLNPLTNDEDLELIFSRFDQNAKAEIIRDPDTGASLQYAFVEFSSNEACNEAYLKMNNALVDDRRIRVDFSQSVAKVWDRYHKRYRRGLSGGVDMGYADGGGRGGGGRGRGRGRGAMESRGRGNPYHARQPPRHNNYDADRNKEYSASRGNPPSPERRHSNNKCSRSLSREEERSKRRSRSCSSDSDDNRKRRHHKHRRSPSSSRSSSASRHRKHKKKHSRRHDHHKHHSRREKKRRKKHRHRSRSRDRSRDRSGSPRPRDSSGGKNGDDSYSRRKREDESDNIRSEIRPERSEGRRSHGERKHHDRRY